MPAGPEPTIAIWRIKPLYKLARKHDAARCLWQASVTRGYPFIKQFRIWLRDVGIPTYLSGAGSDLDAGVIYEGL